MAKETPSGRSPQQLARAILDHELTPPGRVLRSGVSFREQMLMDYEIDDDREVTEHAGPLAIALKSLEAGAPPDRDGNGVLSRALQVIEAYKKEAAGYRDDAARHAREAPHSELLRQDAAEEVEKCAAEISNLNSIEKLVRQLAHRVGVSLIEPGRGR